MRGTCDFAVNTGMSCGTVVPFLVSLQTRGALVGSFVRADLPAETHRGELGFEFHHLKTSPKQTQAEHK
ncbi:hypothetical protein Nmel_009444, partial [Mimus melanotis]